MNLKDKKYMFIDANILLDIYMFSSDDIVELKKLLTLIESDAIEIILPQQVKDEFDRNRPNKIKDAISRFDDVHFVSFPQICRSYEETNNLDKLGKEYKSCLDTLRRKIQSDYLDKKLTADLFLTEFFIKSKIIPITPEITNKAQIRISRGNPPGKGGSLGDAINWEILLDHIPKKESLYFVSYDGDFESPFIRSNMNEFLIEEWRDRKSSSVYYYKRLTDFFKEFYPEIKVDDYHTRQEKIDTLVGSGSFATTHKAIQELTPELPELSAGQIHQIIIALQENSQINQIHSDFDVMNFFRSLYSNHTYFICETDKAILLHYYKREIIEIDNRDVPF